MTMSARVLSLPLVLTLSACFVVSDDSDDDGSRYEDSEECRGLEEPNVNEASPPSGGESVPAQLLSLDGCADMADMTREQALREMEQSMAWNEYYALQSACSGEGSGDGDDGAGSGGGEPPVPAPEGPSDYSGTNNQVEGVDEPDFVKNDGSYIYVVVNGALRIVEAWPANQAHVASVTPIEGEPRKMFIDGDRALVYSSLRPEEGDGGDYDDWPGTWGGSGDCTYGYDCQFVGDGYPTKVTIFDITDRAKPVVEREVWLTGSLISARKIDTAVHTVVSHPGASIPGVSYWPELSGYETPAEIQAAYEGLREWNRRVIRGTQLEEIVPSLREVAHGADGPGQERVVSVCEGGSYRAADDGQNDGDAITSVVTLDIAKPVDAQVMSIVSRPGPVYASADALYLTVPQQPWSDYYGYDTDEYQPRSSVHKFALTSGTTRAAYRGSGVVKGRALNQFAMDEWEGDFRIATSSGSVPDPNVHSTVTVLREGKGELVEVGRVDQLAPGEDIRSVRFDGNRGFIVTFKKTDPLFVLDLATPAEPRVLSELKIPGFSTYMHLMGPDHLLTIGYDADDQGDFAWFTGVLLQVFDISDPNEPTLAHKEVIGTRGSSSEALTNHLAFNYYPQRDALALPMTICEGGDGGGSYGEMTFSGLMVYGVTPEEGFSLTGQVAHPPGEEITCGNWWTDASTQVKRSIFMEDFVYSISESRVKVNAVGALEADIADISLEGE
jgi:Beta propeller domain